MVSINKNHIVAHNVINLIGVFKKSLLKIPIFCSKKSDFFTMTFILNEFVLLICK